MLKNHYRTMGIVVATVAATLLVQAQLPPLLRMFAVTAENPTSEVVSQTPITTIVLPELPQLPRWWASPALFGLFVATGLKAFGAAVVGGNEPWASSSGGYSDKAIVAFRKSVPYVFISLTSLGYFICLCDNCHE